MKYTAYQITKSSKIADIDKLYGEFDIRDKSISKCMEYAKSLEDLCAKLGDGNVLHRHDQKDTRIITQYG